MGTKTQNEIAGGRVSSDTTTSQFRDAIFAAAAKRPINQAATHRALVFRDVTVIDMQGSQSQPDMTE
ncbi:MAG: hypothetical protein ACR2H6_10390 [Pyrinomonadaceae bacterium]